MIEMTINGKVVYPDTSQKIKVTFENQYVKDSGSYTYDIQFPLAILGNKLVFGNIDRLDVRKGVATFEDCKIFVDNRIIMSGKGTVTSITDKTLKLQVIGGKSRIKYNSRFEKHYIDDIDYDDVEITMGLDWDLYTQLNVDNFVMHEVPKVLYISYDNAYMVGQPGVAAFNPINDETNDRTANVIAYFPENTSTLKPRPKLNGIELEPWQRAWVEMYHIAVQPNLLYVFRKVMESEGYTITWNEIDKEPWNRLYIANARNTVRIKDALPHWTVYMLLEEIRKLFNVSIMFNETDKTISIIQRNEIANNGIVTYDHSEEFTCEYDEDGLKNYLTSNVEYSMDDSINRQFTDFFPQEVLMKFSRMYCADLLELVAKTGFMSERQRRTTLFHVGENDWYIWTKESSGAYMENENDHFSHAMNHLLQCGYFNPVMRDYESDESVKLNIIPAAFYKRQKYAANDDDFPKGVLHYDGMRYLNVFIPSIQNDKEVALEDMTYDEEEDDYYYSVEDALESGGVTEEETTDEEDPEEKMAVFFQSHYVINTYPQYYNEGHNDKKDSIVYYASYLPEEDPVMRWPITHTDFREGKAFVSDTKYASLSLTHIYRMSEDIEVHGIEKHNQITIKFYTDEIPDPSKIYVFRNKRFVCEKVEMNVTKDGIEKEKTGYFYEIL